MPLPDLSSHHLTETESEAIFRNEILPVELPPPAAAAADDAEERRGGRHRRRSGKPLVVVAVGQTGAGKTLLGPSILRALSTDTSSSSPPPPTTTAPIIHLVADTFKAYHPQYAQLAGSPATAHLASAATSADARRWLLLAAREAVRRGADVVLESACRHPRDLAELIAVFRSPSSSAAAADYRIEVLVMAVPAGLSRLGILTRFYDAETTTTTTTTTTATTESRRRILPPRLTPVRVHDESYAGLLRAVGGLERDGVDQVLVVRRGNLVAHGWEGGRVGVGEVGRMAVAEAVERERERALTAGEARAALEDMRRLERWEGAREQLEQVRALLEPLMGGGEGQDLDGTCLVPLEFACRDGDQIGSNVLRLGYE